MPELLPYSYRVFPLNLTPGLTDFEIPVHGEVITYAAPTDGPEISVRLQLESNDAIPLRPNGTLQAPFQRLYITAASQARTIYLLIGAPKDIQLTGRDVAISGTINARTYAEYALDRGELFTYGSGFTIAAGDTCHQVLNPAASGKIFDVLWFEITSTGAHTNALSQYGRVDGALTFNNAPDNNTVAGAASSGQYRTGTTIVYTNAFGSILLPANTPRRFDGPWRLAAGQGFGLHLTGAAGAYNGDVRFIVREFAG